VCPGEEGTKEERSRRMSKPPGTRSKKIDLERGLGGLLGGGRRERTARVSRHLNATALDLSLPPPVWFAVETHKMKKKKRMPAEMRRKKNVPETRKGNLRSVCLL